MTRCRVVLLHSIGLEGRSYELLRERLLPRVDLMVYDQRGHGLRTAETDFTLDDLVEDAVQTLAAGDPAVHLVGHSMGGCVAALAAARAMGSVESLVLIATPARGLPVFLERAMACMANPRTATEATLLRWFGTATDHGDVAVTQARQTLQRTAPAGIAAAWRALAGFEGFDAIKRPLPRTLCVAGSDDASTPPAVMQDIVAARRAVQPEAEIELLTLAGAGHMLPLTHPEELASLLLRFWGFAEHTHQAQRA